jgi:PHD/YefM family antitoxin component YafN of YafNO toxin-antitoxin module
MVAVSRNAPRHDEAAKKTLNASLLGINALPMASDFIVTVTAARARLNKLINTDSFAISRHGKIVGIYLSKDRLEALMETMELLSKPGFAKALKDYKSGRMKFHATTDLDKAMLA